MARYSDIKIAFVKAIRREQSGKETVSTQEFIDQLNDVGWNMSLLSANEWIRSNTHTFRDVSTDEGEAKVFQRYNTNGGL